MLHYTLESLDPGKENKNELVCVQEMMGTGTRYHVLCTTVYV